MPKKRPAQKKRSNARYKVIRAEYKTDTNDKHLDSDFVCTKLGKKHHLSPDTIWAIVRKTGLYKHR